MIKIITKSGSTYYIDTENKVVKRIADLSGAKLDSDGKWEQYEGFFPLELRIGSKLQFFWMKLKSKKIKDAYYITTTSRIVDIIKI